MLTEDVLRYIDRSVLCWLATVGEDGWPNVSPKEVFCAHDANTLLIANIASPNSVRNINAHPQVCASFVDVFVQKGYKLRGVARVVKPEASDFSTYLPPLSQMAGEAFPIHSIFAVHVTAVEPILAPSYRLVPGTTEASQVASAMATYGVVRQ